MDYSVGFRRWIGRLLGVAACCLLLQAGTARGDLVLRVSYAGTDFDFAAGGVDTLTLSQAELDTLNADLAFLGADFEFNALAGTTTSPDGNPGTLTVTSKITSLLATTDTVDVLATSTDYDPGGLNTPVIMNSSNSDTYTLAPIVTNNTAFTSWFNPGNAEFAQEQVSPVVALASANPNSDSQSANAAHTPILGVQGALYGLTNLTTINIDATGAGTVIGTNGTTVVIAAVPEPASLALVAGLLPLGAIVLVRRRTTRRG
jgi:hypothetical protein